MGDPHHFHHHHHPRPKSQVFCDDDDDDDLDFPERSSSSTGLRHFETHHSVQNHSQNKSELEQLRQRVCQMEKTMRWWSDCTSNWKQKWSQVRQERNALRNQLKEITGGSVTPKPEMKLASVQTEPYENSSQQEQITSAQTMNTAADVHLLTKLLDEAQRTINIEREEKLHLHRSIERLQQDMLEFHTMYDELVKEVQLLKMDDNSSNINSLDEQATKNLTSATAQGVKDVRTNEPELEQQQQLQPETEMDSAVDGDADDEYDEDEHDYANVANSNEVTTGTSNEPQDEVTRATTENGCNSNSNRMSHSASQQLTGNSPLANDADHHTSL